MCGLNAWTSTEYGYTTTGQTVLVLLFNFEPFFSCIQIRVSMFVACCVPLADRRFVWLCSAQTGDISYCGQTVFTWSLLRFRSPVASELSVRFCAVFCVVFGRFRLRNSGFPVLFTLFSFSYGVCSMLSAIYCSDCCRCVLQLVKSAQKGPGRPFGWRKDKDAVATRHSPREASHTRCFRYTSCPTLLIIDLKRWLSHRKSSKQVAVPALAHVDALNSDYAFVAAACHHGPSLAAGHWTVIGSRGSPAVWYRFNDDEVSVVDINSVLQSADFRASVTFVVFKRVGEQHVAPMEIDEDDNDSDGDAEMKEAPRQRRS